MTKLLFKTNNTHNSSIRSDEGLTLETSAFQIFHGGLVIRDFEQKISYASVNKKKRGCPLPKNPSRVWLKLR